MDLIQQIHGPRFEQIRVLEQASGIATSTDDEILVAVGTLARRAGHGNFNLALESLISELSMLAAVAESEGGCHD